MSRNIILLVEDNPSDAMLITHTLEQQNLSYEIVLARDGVEALDYLFATGKFEGRDPNVKPLVIFLDLKLPKIDGLEVLRIMRSSELTKLLPVAILTSSDEEKDIVESYLLGANSYVCKPVDFNEFTRAVIKLGQYWALLNQPPLMRS